MKINYFYSFMISIVLMTSYNFPTLQQVTLQIDLRDTNPSTWPSDYEARGLQPNARYMFKMNERDRDGNHKSGGPSQTVNTLTTEKEIDDLFADFGFIVNALFVDKVLNHGQEQALASSLDGADRQRQNGNIAVAIKMLKALKRKVKAYINADILSDEQGDPLIVVTDKIISALEQLDLERD